MTTPDIGVQKITVQKQNLPSLDSDNKYLVRYRIKSNDGIATTAWSTVHRATKPSIQDLTYDVDEKEIKSHGKSFDMSWKILPTTPEQIRGIPLDVYAKWGSSTEWTYISTTTSNSLSFPIPDAYQSTPTESYTVDIMVHLSTFKKDRLNTNLQTLLFIQEDVPTKTSYDLDSGTIA
jgi:hypothetical protein